MNTIFFKGLYHCCCFTNHINKSNFYRKYGIHTVELCLGIHMYEEGMVQTFLLFTSQLKQELDIQCLKAPHYWAFLTDRMVYFY